MLQRSWYFIKILCSWGYYFVCYLRKVLFLAIVADLEQSRTEGFRGKNSEQSSPKDREG